MGNTNLLLFVCLGYVCLLFLIAFIVDAKADKNRSGWLSSPIIYTLSISIYCTSWTFYGAVGTAARSGLEFLTIYLGPSIVFIGWWFVLHKLVRIGRMQRITSIADLISSRFGKSTSLAVLVTVMAVFSALPYIALQMQSVTRSYHAITGTGTNDVDALLVTLGMAIFGIMFGTRNLNANERHYGVVAAIAIEAIVKLVALIAVGVYAIFGLLQDTESVFTMLPLHELEQEEIFNPRWLTMLFLSATAIICLPRQFHVTVVENTDERHLVTASWLFPLYLFAMCLFILPIAAGGRIYLSPDDNPDLYVLTLPLSQGQEGLALLAFIGGFSSATSMIIVATIALSIMISNHIILPLSLYLRKINGSNQADFRSLLLSSRRISILAILLLSYTYFLMSGGSNLLSSMGLIAFAGVAQFLPSIIGGLFWRGATRLGALSGQIIGFTLWAYTLFLPSFAGGLFSEEWLYEGPFGIYLLRPHAMMGLIGFDPLVHAVIWSITANVLCFLIVSAFTRPRAIEHLQAALFVDVFRTSEASVDHYVRRSATTEDLYLLAQQILGKAHTQRLFREWTKGMASNVYPPHPTDAFIAKIERELAGSIGAASAHAMITQIAGSGTISITELMKIANETQRLIETSDRLSERTKELQQTAAQLREANTLLRRLDAQKDDFLSQVSHELRTPMTSIRSLSEILLEKDSLDPEQSRRFARIIHDESLRLTRLLDEILNLSQLESGEQVLKIEKLSLNQLLDHSIISIDPLARKAGMQIILEHSEHDPWISGNADRLTQVFINLAGNAIKYNNAKTPELRIVCQKNHADVTVDFIDNGPGISRDEAKTIFSKFFRGAHANRAPGAGLGLPISRAIMRRMNGDLTVEFHPETGRSFFRVIFPDISTSEEAA